MSQELIDDSETYMCFKDIITEEILSSNIESSLNMISESTIFAHFMNDDYEEAIIFEELVMFLHRHYFSWLAWAKLTLNSIKCRFFVEKLKILNFERSESDI